ncbi:MAG: accessory factor UbiK family protein [Kiloniellales bacterium]
MQSDKRILDDLARVLSGAMGATSGIRGDLESRLREPMERLAERLQLVTREEFELVREMAETARQEQENLAERVRALEAELAELKAKAPKRRTTKAKAASNAG